LPVSVFGVLIWASRARLHKAMTLCISLTQAIGRKHWLSCRAPLRRGQFLGQNPSPLNILVDPERLLTMRTVRVLGVITKPVHIKMGRLRFLVQKHALSLLSIVALQSVDNR